jgi:ABC-type hemin transport system substrate-binding protein
MKDVLEVPEITKTSVSTKAGETTKATKHMLANIFFVCFVIFTIFVLAPFSTLLGAQPTRIISLIPAVTEMLFAIGAGPKVVAVSSSW